MSMIRDFKFHNMSLKELIALPFADQIKLFRSKIRRKLNRGLKEDEHKVFVELQNNDSASTKSREMIFFPFMVGKTVNVYNGREYIPITIKEEMIGTKFKEYASSRLQINHGKPGKGATSSSKFTSLK